MVRTFPKLKFPDASQCQPCMQALQRIAVRTATLIFIYTDVIKLSENSLMLSCLDLVLLGGAGVVFMVRLIISHY